MMRVVLRKNPRHTGVMVFMWGDDKEQKHHHPCVPRELETFLVRDLVLVSIHFQDS